MPCEIAAEDNDINNNNNNMREIDVYNKVTYIMSISEYNNITLRTLVIAVGPVKVKEYYTYNRLC